LGFLDRDQATLQDTARRVCAARNVALAACDILWSFDLPRLNQRGHRQELRQFLRTNRVHVVFIDPLYLCLLNGNRSISASNLYEVGPLLWLAARTCLDAGATPILVHHATKAAARRSFGSSEPLDLDDLSFAGIGEFARQWILLSGRERFQPAFGRHRRVLTTGGSAGQAGWWDVVVEEGTLKHDFTGRRWHVEVRGGGAAYETASKRPNRTQRTTRNASGATQYANNDVF